MNSQDIQTLVLNYVSSKNDFNAPYGVLSGNHVNGKGHKFKSVTFGRSRTLDATVEIYNSKFMILKSSVQGKQVFTDVKDLMAALALI